VEYIGRTAISNSTVRPDISMRYLDQADIADLVKLQRVSVNFRPKIPRCREFVQGEVLMERIF